MKEGMIDNRKVKDTHQKGIERIIQRDRDNGRCYDGKMGKGGKTSYKDTSTSSTPKSA